MYDGSVTLEQWYRYYFYNNQGRIGVHTAQDVYSKFQYQEVMTKFFWWANVEPQLRV